MYEFILIVDDDRELCELMRQLLEASGCQVKMCHSFDQVSAAGDSIDKCNVVFLDIDLGSNQPNGVEVYKYLVERHFPGKIYFLTGHGKNHPHVVRAREIGAVDVLSKPIAPMEILRLANRVML